MLTRKQLFVNNCPNAFTFWNWGIKVFLIEFNALVSICWNTDWIYPYSFTEFWKIHIKDATVVINVDKYFVKAEICVRYTLLMQIVDSTYQLMKYVFYICLI